MGMLPVWQPPSSASALRNRPNQRARQVFTGLPGSPGNQFMRTSIILAVQHKGGAELLAGPSMSLADQQAMLRTALASDRIDDEIAELQHWTSDGGLQRSVKFKTPTLAKAEAEQAAKDTAAHKASQEAKAKPEGKIKPQGKAETKPVPASKNPQPTTEKQ